MVLLFIDIYHPSLFQGIIRFMINLIHRILGKYNVGDIVNQLY